MVGTYLKPFITLGALYAAFLSQGWKYTCCQNTLIVQAAESYVCSDQWDINFQWIYFLFKRPAI